MEKHLSACDQIWHAGDIGNLKTADRLAQVKPLRAVHGNIDDHRVRSAYPAHERFECGGLDIWLTHIGGYPGRYDKSLRKELQANPPDLFICGHSHILKVMYDEKLDLLHINPGAAGRSGLHRVRTLIRFSIAEKQVKDLEVVELEHRRP
jgi:hypothetical protein